MDRKKRTARDFTKEKMDNQGFPKLSGAFKQVSENKDNQEP